jgi:hypothetical protein
LPLLSQHHSTAIPLPKRYENRDEQELQEERSMPAPATHEDMVVPRMWRWGSQVLSPNSVLMVNTPLTPSQSDEDGF